MKYMGSKRAMLLNGLGETISREITTANRFIDLFTGSGAVAWYVASRWEKKVYASDLQQFSVTLAEAVISRNYKIEGNKKVDEWIKRSEEKVRQHPDYKEALKIQERLDDRGLISLVADSRALCSEITSGHVQSAYGGYYFSPFQALWIDSLRSSLPRDADLRNLALAALIQASSQCAASPGHTAQPFKPNRTAGPYLKEAWRRSVVSVVKENSKNIGKISAKLKGGTWCKDAEIVAKKIKEGDLVFIDPPYSGVHYSRFYHVLETVAQGRHVPVSGSGRYPPTKKRPRSDFSIATKSALALGRLLSSLASNGARAILTFPSDDSSNGLSGNAVVKIAEEFFRIDKKSVGSCFSTLGGNRKHREARQRGRELILTLSAK